MSISEYRYVILSKQDTLWHEIKALKRTVSRLQSLSLTSDELSINQEINTLCKMISQLESIYSKNQVELDKIDLDDFSPYFQEQIPIMVSKVIEYAESSNEEYNFFSILAVTQSFADDAFPKRTYPAPTGDIAVYVATSSNSCTPSQVCITENCYFKFLQYESKYGNYDKRWHDRYLGDFRTYFYQELQKAIVTKHFELEIERPDFKLKKRL